MVLGTVDFYYFSGTGNTLLVVKKMKETFEMDGVEVNMHPIEKSDPNMVNLEHTIGLAFPVAGLSTYPFIWKFFEEMPETSGTNVFMVDSLAGYSGGIIGPLREKLEKKGYSPIGAREIIMPPNIFYIQKGESCQSKVDKGIKKAEKYAQDLLKGKASWGRVPIFSDLLYSFGMTLMKAWEWESQQRWFGFRVKKSKCSQCGTCAQICPLKNIEMKEYPIYKCKCQFCMRCVSFCPMKAIPCKINYKGETHRAVKVGNFLNKELELR